MVNGELLLPKLQLVEFNGSPEQMAAIHAEQDFLKQVWQAPEGLPIEIYATLPHIVGYIPEEEREIFQTTRIPRTATPEEVNRFLPKTMTIIEEDLSAIDFTPNLCAPFFETAQVKAGNAQLSDILHIDFTNLSPEEIKFLLSASYVVASNNPTEFYKGPAQIMPTLEPSGWTKLKLVLPPKPEESGEIVQAPPFSIIRMTNLTVHRSPKFEETGSRSFLRVWCRQRTPIARAA
jgi:hypothetical protein